MADGFSDINSTISFKLAAGSEFEYEADISNYTETSISRKVNYTKVIGGMILPRTQLALSKEISFNFVSNDLTFDNLWGGELDTGTISFTPVTGSFEVGDTIIGDSSNAVGSVIKKTASLLTVNFITGSFIDNEDISETLPDTVATGSNISFTDTPNTQQSDWDTFDKYKISLLFDNTEEIYKKVFYNAYVLDYVTNIKESVLQGTIKFSIPMKNINGDSNFYVYNADVDNDTTMGY